jgi:very-short-patch-repair endonuclease
MRSGFATFKRARSLRRVMTRPEVILWERLRGERLAGLRFRRQHPVGPFVLDFYCASAKLCVEVDGAAHDFVAQAEKDERRTRWLEERGIRVLRIMAKDILEPESLGSALAAIAAEAAPSTGFAGPPPPLCG